MATSTTKPEFWPAARRHPRLLAVALVSMLLIVSVTTAGLLQNPWPQTGPPPPFRCLIDLDHLRVSCSVFRPVPTAPVAEPDPDTLFDSFAVTLQKLPVTTPVTGHVYRVRTPLFLVQAILLLPSIILVRVALRDVGRMRRGRCLVCDYDLRASCQRCPECGTETPPPAPNLGPP